MSDKVETEFNAKENTPHKGESIYIKASAGTGKTYNIQKMVRQLLERKDVAQLEKILIVTFTEKAAGELRDRIRKELAGDAKVPKIEADVDNAPIYTIHSFCQHTLEEFAFTAKKPASLALIDEGEISDFIDRAIRDGLENDENFRKEFIQIFENAEKKASFIEALKEDLQKAVGRYYPDEKIVKLDEIYCEYKTKNIEYSFAECDAFLSQIESGTEDKEVSNVFSRKGTDARNKKISKYKTARFYRNFLKSLYQAWQKEKAQNKQQTFDDMIRNVREAVCEENSALKNELQKKYDVAIIDEFQDTNQQQWDIFREVFLNESHSLIVVGDPKQSIYAFQGADVKVYENAIDEIGNGYKLSHNYRSTDEMIDACNKLFEQDFFNDSGIDFFKSDPPDALEDKTLNATFDGKGIKPFWICKSEKKEENGDGSVKKSAGPVSAEEFAKLAVKKIVECCTFVKDEKTRLQVYDKKKKVYRNVSFKDFAILAKTSPEMEEIENAMKQAGIPFLRYKDKNLFSGIECRHWISLINAIAAPDFTGRNRAFLSEALFTRFFDLPLEAVKDEQYDSPACEERKAIIEWQNLAENRKWARLLESIFEKTKIEDRLFGLDNLQSLSKFRQIGEYIVEYLYKNDSSLEAVSKHLSRLAACTEGAEDEGSLVARGTDFDCVQVMSIHASKGLEFPVVIAVGGFNGRRTQIPHVYLYHKDKQAKLSFTEYGKDKMQKEEAMEWQRLFYVAYTRASSLMILPDYESFISSDVKNALTAFIESEDKNAKNPENPGYQQVYEKIIFTEAKQKNYNFCKDLNNDVQEILKHKKVKEFDGSSAESQEAEFQKLDETGKRILNKYSYSRLGHKKIDLNEYVSDKNTLEEDEEDDEEIRSDLKGYPRGSKLGLALHIIFEKIDFKTARPLDSADFGKKISDFEEFCGDSEVKALIDASFSEQGFKIDEEDSRNWRKNTAQIVWNTISAQFKEFSGSNGAGNSFSLREISLKNRTSEAEFNFSTSEFRNYFNGFIDLLFVRQIDGKDVYSLLDWKSDSLADYSESATADRTGKKYAVQMVLYSYCLVKWLKTFPKYSGMSEEEIYKKHFGGMYYVYLRGTKTGTSNGIFAQRWDSWGTLNDIFQNQICAKLKTEN